MVESGSLLRSYAREGIKGSNPFPTDFFNYFQKKIKGFESDTDNNNMRNFLNNIFGDTRDTWAQAILFVLFIVFAVGGFWFAFNYTFLF